LSAVSDQDELDFFDHNNGLESSDIDQIVGTGQRHVLHIQYMHSKSQIPLRQLVRRRLRTCSKLIRVKLHYTSWFGASSELAPNMFGASSELASVMEFGFYCTDDVDVLRNKMHFAVNVVEKKGMLRILEINGVSQTA